MKTRVVAVLSGVGLLALCVPVTAHPLPGEVLKFQQVPMNGTPIVDAQGVVTQYYGHDELSTAYWNATAGGYQGTYMADDFADTFSTPVVHVRWWGSYPFTTNPGGVSQFAIVFESDVPAGPTSAFSHPGSVLLGQTVVKGPLAPGSGTFTETLVGPGGAPLNEPLYEYNAELSVPFSQKADTVYWLKIVALVDPTTDPGVRWGWHNRDYTIFDPLASAAVLPGERDEQPLIDPTYPTAVWHFQDDAVTGDVIVPGQPQPVPHPINVIQTTYAPVNYVDDLDGPGSVPGTVGGNIGQFSKDLAFELYTIPEPATAVLLGLGALGMAVRRHRR